ncbi:MAG TPA: hypothetical protein VNT76_19760 [Candidatus Binatus sp.]|nr:hypothetical protein [Candidatus Binatus sp.]
MTRTQIADEAIGLFLEYRDQHGYDEDVARIKAVADVADSPTNEEWAALQEEIAADAALAAAYPPCPPNPDIPF